MEYLILAVVITTASYQSFQIGVREGAERTIKKLHEEKIISVAVNGDIKPNPFYIETDS